MRKSGGSARAEHQFPAVYDENSRLLILGSFPSVASRKINFFYGHPQNRFWRVLSSCFGQPLPKDNDERKALCLRHGVALYDSIESCLIRGSADSTIEDVAPADLKDIFARGKIRRLIFNGKAAEKYFYAYQQAPAEIEVICLPSTSAANAAWSLPRLLEAWKPFLCDKQN